MYRPDGPEAEVPHFRRVFLLSSRASFGRCEIFEEFAGGPSDRSSSARRSPSFLLLLSSAAFGMARPGRGPPRLRPVLFFPCTLSTSLSSPIPALRFEPSEASNVALSSLSIRADSVELPSSKVSASNEAINKSTALTGLSTLFVRDDVSILLQFFSCLRVREDNPFLLSR